jgi:hypothetical protein
VICHSMWRVHVGMMPPLASAPQDAHVLVRLLQRFQELLETPEASLQAAKFEYSRVGPLRGPCCCGPPCCCGLRLCRLCYSTMHAAKLQNTRCI